MGTKSAGERLRQRRLEVLRKGLREMAGILEISAAHLTDIEKDRRKPSEGLLQKIRVHYRLDDQDVAEIRSAWQKADTVVDDVATQDALTAEKVPQFLRTARNLSKEDWDRMISQARRLAGEREDNADD